MEEKLTAWSFEVAEYEHQLKIIDEAQKIFVVRGDDARRHQTGVLDGTEKI